jgi:fructose-1,6-bisphosphatase I
MSKRHCNCQNDVQAGGVGSTGQERVLDICPEKVHQRVPLFVGSPKEVEYLESFIKK